MSLKDSVYKRLVYSKSNNKEIMIGVVIDTVNEELFISLLQSYQQRLELINDKKATINLQNTDHKCFQYAVTVALTHERIEHTQKNYQRLFP